MRNFKNEIHMKRAYRQISTQKNSLVQCVDMTLRMLAQIKGTQEIQANDFLTKFM